MKKFVICIGIVGVILFFTFLSVKVLDYKKSVFDSKSDDINKVNMIENVTKPYLLQEDCEILEEDVEKGMTIRDSYGNEWVWIVVPKTEVFVTAKDAQDYENIFCDIKEYTRNYSSLKYTDDLAEYQELKEKTLKSIFNYGGFWISRYEIGCVDVRKDSEDTGVLQEPVSQQNMYLYNYVTFDNAKKLANEISGGEYESNLMFGFQWDLVCKFFETNGYLSSGEKINKSMLNENSSKLGNYYTSSFMIDRGEYSLNYGKEYVAVNDNEIKRGYRFYILTTGASDYAKICNVYDFAGNAPEWTLEQLVSSR